MIPSIYTDDFMRDFTAEKQTDLTYRIDFENKCIAGMITEEDALKQAIYLMLETERFFYEIYSWNYGNELKELIGKPTHLAQVRAKKIIIETLLLDERILSVEKFVFERTKDVLAVTFNVITEISQIEIRKELENV